MDFEIPTHLVRDLARWHGQLKQALLDPEGHESNPHEYGQELYQLAMKSRLSALYRDENGSRKERSSGLKKRMWRRATFRFLSELQKASQSLAHETRIPDEDVKPVEIHKYVSHTAVPVLNRPPARQARKQWKLEKKSVEKKRKRMQVEVDGETDDLNYALASRSKSKPAHRASAKIQKVAVRDDLEPAPSVAPRCSAWRKRRTRRTRLRGQRAWLLRFNKFGIQQQLPDVRLTQRESLRPKRRKLERPSTTRTEAQPRSRIRLRHRTFSRSGGAMPIRSVRLSTETKFQPRHQERVEQWLKRLEQQGRFLEKREKDALWQAMANLDGPDSSLTSLSDGDGSAMSSFGQDALMEEVRAVMALGDESKANVEKSGQGDFH